jgi:hypothetical protein
MQTHQYGRHTQNPNRAKDNQWKVIHKKTQLTRQSLPTSQWSAFGCQNNNVSQRRTINASAISNEQTYQREYLRKFSANDNLRKCWSFFERPKSFQCFHIQPDKSATQFIPNYAEPAHQQCELCPKYRRTVWKNSRIMD